MKKQVMLLNCLHRDGRPADVKDFYLIFRGKFTDEPFLLTSIRNFSLAMKSLTYSESSLRTSGFLSFLQIPLTNSTQFLLRADINGYKSILVLSIKDNTIQLKPATVFDELTEEMFTHILTCFTLKRKNKYISFLLQPHKDKPLKSSNHPLENDNSSVKFVKKPHFPNTFT
ncbi:hypothetical protein [Bacillus sp. AK031]